MMRKRRYFYERSGCVNVENKLIDEREKERERGGGERERYILLFSFIIALKRNFPRWL